MKIETSKPISKTGAYPKLMINSGPTIVVALSDRSAIVVYTTRDIFKPFENFDGFDAQYWSNYTGSITLSND